MSTAFSVLVTSARWHADVETWVHDRILERGHHITGPLEQRRVRAWSTQIVVPTDAGRLWFKAVCPSMRHEPGLHALLADLVPDDVDRPYAVDVDRGWMLMTDRGSTLGESHEPTTDDWRAVVTATAGMQRALAPHRDAIVATGVPDCSPATVPDRFERLLERFTRVPAEHRSHADPELAARLRGVLPRIVDAAAELAESPMPSTVQHGDVHPWNVFAAGTPPRTSLRVFDFGDVQWAPAVEVLAVPYGVIADEGRLPWEPVRDAYVAEWSDLVSARGLHSLFEATAFTQPVNRSQTWWDALADATEDEWGEWGIAPRQHLTRVLDA